MNVILGNIRWSNNDHLQISVIQSFYITIIPLCYVGSSACKYFSRILVFANQCDCSMCSDIFAILVLCALSLLKFGRLVSNKTVVRSRYGIMQSQNITLNQVIWYSCQFSSHWHCGTWNEIFWAFALYVNSTHSWLFHCRQVICLRLAYKL